MGEGFCAAADGACDAGAFAVAGAWASCAEGESASARQTLEQQETMRDLLRMGIAISVSEDISPGPRAKASARRRKIILAEWQAFSDMQLGEK
jgi:hypothetical protein